MRVLVSGGAGYIGSHTVRALIKEKHQPIVVDNLICGNEKVIKKFLNVPFVPGNIGDSKLIFDVLSGQHPNLKKTSHYGRPIEAVIHFAAFTDVRDSVKNPIKYYLNNVVESIKLLEILCSKKIRELRQGKSIPIIFSSTCATYGIPEKSPIDENQAQNPINPYGRSKLMVENIIKDLSINSTLQSVILRYFNASGASEDSMIGEDHDPETHLIPLALKAALGISSGLEIFGDDYLTKDGTCIRDYIHVVDLARAHVLALNLFKDDNNDSFCKIYNLGNGKGVSVKEIILSVEKVTNKKVPYQINSRRVGDPAILIASSEKIKQELNWEPLYRNIDEIVFHAYKWIKKQYRIDN